MGLPRLILNTLGIISWISKKKAAILLLGNNRNSAMYFIIFMLHLGPTTTLKHPLK